MPYDLDQRLVVGVSSSSMFDLAESDQVFRSSGEEAYRQYQSENLANPFSRGIAFSFIRRLLSFNALFESRNPFVEVILLSRNDPDTGLRVMRSIQHYGLDITRAVFCQGKSPYSYIGAFNICLFLSGNQFDVTTAIQNGFPAGHVIDSKIQDDETDSDLRIAFDFDGVLADDQSESVMQATQDLLQFHAHEQRRVVEPLPPGPLQQFLLKIKYIQEKELERKKVESSFRPRLRVALVTARNAPSHERAINTLKSWGVMPNEAFFLGGIDKRRILEVLKPHVFFDDQERNIVTSASVTPSVHIPFGVCNSITSASNRIAGSDES